MRIAIVLAAITALALIIVACGGGKSPKSAPADAGPGFTGEPGEVKIMTLDPGHFHSALVQKSMYDAVDPVVHVYAPEGPEVEQHLALIRSYNTRAENPTHWEEKVYTGEDYLERMLSEKPGNVVVLAGNNGKKTEYILKSIQSGINVLADKPMAIDREDFETLRKAFGLAAEKNLLLYDIMTERYEITTILQKELSLLTEVFGTLEEGSPDNPAVTKESVHHLFKYVSGKPLTRPAWFLDEAQEGEGMVDVATHLVDLIQWECFPQKIIDYEKDIVHISARRWATELSLEQFTNITKLESFPEYLEKNLTENSTLAVHCNGEMNYRLFGVHAKVSVIWAYQAPEGTGDTHYSIMRGTRSNLIIRQGREENFVPTLYIEPVGENPGFGEILAQQFGSVREKYPDLELEQTGKGWKVIIPDKYRVGHEAHFAQVTRKYLEYLTQGDMPDWEVPNMIAKYYTTTRALELAKASE